MYSDRQILLKNLDNYTITQFTIPSITDLGFILNRRAIGYADSEINSLNRSVVLAPNVEENIPLSEINQIIPPDSIDYDRMTINTLKVNQYIESFGYESGVAGFRINGNGDVEFNDGIFRGLLEAAEIHIPNQTADNSFHTNDDGDSWWGANVADYISSVINAKARITKEGNGFFQNIEAKGMMKGVTFVKDVISVIAGMMKIANADVLDVDMTAADNSTLTIKGSSTFATDDMLIIQAETGSGIEVERLRVTDDSSAPTYVVERDLAGDYASNNNPAWKAGTTVTKQGTSDGISAYGGGWLEIIGEGTNSPFYSVYQRTGLDYDDYVEILRIGNLNGFLDYATDIFGFAVGSSSGTNANITIDLTNGIRVRSGTTNVFSVDNNGGAIVNQVVNDTAGENLTAQDLAAIEGGGVYKTVKRLNSLSQLGSISSNPQFVDAIYLSDGRVALVYLNGSTDDITCVAMDVARMTATPGTAVAVAGTMRKPVACLIDTDKIAAIYANTADSDKLYGVIFTISGTTVTAGTPVKLYNTEGADTNSNLYYDVCKLDTDKFLAVMRGSTSNDPIAIACSVSGTVITAGTGVALEAVTMTGGILCTQIRADVAAVFYDDGTNLSYMPLNVSGTTITVHTIKDLYAGKIGGRIGDDCFAIDLYNLVLINYNSTSRKIIVTVIGNRPAWESTQFNATSSSFDIQSFDDSSGVSAYQFAYLGNYRFAAIFRTTSSDEIFFKIYEFHYGAFKEVFTTSLSQTNLQQDFAIAKIDTTGSWVIVFLREAGGGTLRYAVYLNTENSYVGVVKTTTPAASSVPIIIAGSATIAGVAKGLPYYVGDNGVAKVTGDRLIGIGSATNTILLK